jgi:hypothetical protein
MPRFRFTIAGEYDAEGSEIAYGTTDPKDMARQDEEQLRDDPASFLDEATEFTVRWLPI